MPPLIKLYNFKGLQLTPQLSELMSISIGKKPLFFLYMPVKNWTRTLNSQLPFIVL